jgi:hypothetical protein
MRHRTPSASTHDAPPLWVDLAETLVLPAAVIYVLLAVQAVFGPSSDLRDFGAFYRSAVAWRSGSDLYAGSGTGFVVPNLNPPVFTVLFSPVTWLPVREGLIVWWAANIVALGVSVAIIARELSVRPSPRMILLGIAFAGTQAQLLLGQVAWVCMLLATLSWRGWRREQDIRAGLWLGVLIGLKPLFLPVLGVAAVRKQWRLLIAAACTLLLSVAVGALACGWTAWSSWLRAGAGITWFALPLNASLRGALARFASDTVSFPIWLAATGLALGFAAWRLVQSRSNPDRDVAVGFLTSLLVSPLGWVYYIPVALGPLMATLKGVKWRWWSLLGVACLLWPPGVGWGSIEQQLERGLSNALVGSVYTVGLFTLWWLSLQSAVGEMPDVRTTREVLRFDKPALDSHVGPRSPT